MSGANRTLQADDKTGRYPSGEEIVKSSAASSADDRTRVREEPAARMRYSAGESGITWGRPVEASTRTSASTP